MLRKKITEQDIVNKIGDYSIFNFYFGAFEFNKNYPSIFRKDKNPSTGFFINKEGRIVYNDFATGEKYGVIRFVMKLYGLDYPNALEKIGKDFGIINHNVKTNYPKIYNNDYSNVKTEKIIRVGVQKWKQIHLDYWNQFSITQEELDQNFVYPVKTLYINDWVVPNEKNELRFAYKVNYKEHQYIKVYSPYSKDFKWVMKCPNHAPFGWNELPFKSDTLLITKGQKDRIVFKKFFTDVIALQSESKSGLKAEDIVFLQQHYKKIYINFDCDKAGKENVKYFEELGWTPIFVPDVYYENDGIKDFADLVKAKGLKTMYNYLKWKNVL